MEKPRIAVTYGDPAGIGPEVVLKALGRPELLERCDPVVVGDPNVLHYYSERLGIPVSAECLSRGPSLPAGKLRPGFLDPECGRAAVETLREAARLVRRGRFQALVTGPLNKEAMRAAGVRAEGQTELLARWAQVRRFGMLVIAGGLRVLLLTRHLPLRKALRRVRKDLVLDHLLLGHEGLRRWGIEKPRIAVAGLNPHAGEGGLFGDEEREEVLPAVEEAKLQGVDACGPFSPDTIFRRAAAGEFDLVLALYHDQAFIPVKMVGFDKAVTTILGLPYLRVSVIHGTAFDIAGRGVADATNMAEALRVAADLFRKPNA